MREFLWVSVFFLSLQAQGAWLVKQSGDRIISVKPVTREISKKNLVIKEIPEYIAEGKNQNQLVIYKETLYQNDSLPKELKSYIQNTLAHWPNSEVITLIDQGPTSNRIDLTILGDGYTLAEKEKFFSDARRLTDDLFGESTFKSYLPLFNVHAVFVPSNESGISDRTQVDTVFGLRRSPAGSKRAIYPGNTREIERAIDLAPDTDYPILVANDDFYGGLGGRYAITTRSLNSGSMVLRHELGHNFGEVGEEYDGGSVYSGANSSRSRNVPWSHWLENDLKVFESKMLSGDYVWQNLWNRPYKANFSFPSGSYYLGTTSSTVGWSHENDVTIKIDGNPISYHGVYTPDRSFFYFRDDNIHAGSHRVEITDADEDRNDVLAFMNIYAHPKDIITDKHFIGAYSNFNSNGSHVGYRPTFDSCLMRDMRSVDFCHVDKENMWNKFFKRVHLIDDIKSTQNGKEQLIQVNAIALDGLTYQWFKVNDKGVKTLLPEAGQTLRIDTNQRGKYEVQVQFQSTEIRKPKDGFFDSRQVEI